ncbi:RNA polymerase sigma-70 factor (ECF subfamily) [Pontibacter mucosus]|uniref:RNA polymerase sigma-70 factor (ECF subfamily) n=1 Tax=Pontibacter mucosus TaxID=1649266 RepID=A0A2T5YQF1_9BACT|nr:sigma-70 family RNA polymerase sigma factor [Pontibacter mucosus]PTX21542.1 RNA polymerase sigma-70 factor (ECF subfamily) [Pontibacter mucosus]
MAEHVNDTFMQQLNQHLGIAHKVCGLYFDDAEEKQDVIQEMLYQLWRSYPSFDGRSRFSTWMYRVCLNTALTYRRKERKHQNQPLSEGHHQIPDEPVSHQEESIKLLHAAIASLSPLNKAIVLLYLEDLRYEEIAQITGLTKSNVSVRLVRIKKELESMLKKQENPYAHANPR